MNTKIRINLFRDWAEFLRLKLAEMGYTIYPTVTDEKACLYYYDISERSPSNTPREVLKASCFTCPNGHEQGILALEMKIRNGEDIKPHLSLGILDPDNFDGLLLEAVSKVGNFKIVP